MNYDAPYTMGRRPGLARALQRGGRWEDALAVLPGDQRAARAEVLADRFWWRLDGAAEAAAAVSDLAPDDPVLAGFYGAQLAYTRLLFRLDPGPGDLDLRAALGARPQTAAAAVTLAGELRPGEEAGQLREAAAITARELRLTWLLREL